MVQKYSSANKLPLIMKILKLLQYLAGFKPRSGTEHKALYHSTFLMVYHSIIRRVCESLQVGQQLSLFIN